MTGKGLGFTAVTDADGGIAGIFTDGDLRRLIESGADLRVLRAAEVMHPGRSWCVPTRWRSMRPS